MKKKTQITARASMIAVDLILTSRSTTIIVTGCGNTTKICQLFKCFLGSIISIWHFRSLNHSNCLLVSVSDSGILCNGSGIMEYNMTITTKMAACAFILILVLAAAAAAGAKAPFTIEDIFRLRQVVSPATRQFRSIDASPVPGWMDQEE